MIRRYTPHDKTALLELIQLNIPQYFDPAEADDFSKYLDEEVEDYFVVEDQGIIIGAGGINYFPAKRLARISWDIIHPDAQGKGIGAALTQHRIEHILKNPGMDHIVVRTSQLAYGFYQKQGFELEKIEKDFWAEGYDLYQMILERNESNP